MSRPAADVRRVEAAPRPLVFSDDVRRGVAPGLRSLRSGRTSIKMVDWDWDKKKEEEEYDGPGKERGQVSSHAAAAEVAARPQCERASYPGTACRSTGRMRSVPARSSVSRKPKGRPRRKVCTRTRKSRTPAHTFCALSMRVSKLVRFCLGVRMETLTGGCCDFAPMALLSLPCCVRSCFVMRCLRHAWLLNNVTRFSRSTFSLSLVAPLAPPRALRADNCRR